MGSQSAERIEGKRNKDTSMLNDLFNIFEEIIEITEGFQEHF